MPAHGRFSRRGRERGVTGRLLRVTGRAVLQAGVHRNPFEKWNQGAREGISPCSFKPPVWSSFYNIPLFVAVLISASSS